MKKQFTKLWFNGGVVALASLAIVGVGYVFAQPTSAPGTGPGVYLPINVGPDPQIKAGSLTVTELCFSGDGSCQTAAGAQRGTVTVADAAQVGVCSPTTWAQNPFGKWSNYCDAAINVNIPVSVSGIGVGIAASNFNCAGYTYGYVWPPGAYEYTLCGTQSGCPEAIEVISKNISINGNNINVTATCRIWGNYGQPVYTGYDVTADVIYLN